MNDSNVITSEDGRIASALHSLKRCAKEVDKLTDGFHPPLGGERYMTDKDRKIPYIVFGGKVLYRESDIEKMLAENYRKAIL